MHDDGFVAKATATKQFNKRDSFIIKTRTRNATTRQGVQTTHMLCPEDERKHEDGMQVLTETESETAARTLWRSSRGIICTRERRSIDLGLSEGEMNASGLRLTQLLSKIAPATDYKGG